MEIKRNKKSIQGERHCFSSAIKSKTLLLLKLQHITLVFISL